MAERRLELAIHPELEVAFEQHRHLLPGCEAARRYDPDREQVVITWAVPGAPDDAVAMCPWFTRTHDGSVHLEDIEYLDANGHRIQTEPTATPAVTLDQIPEALRGPRWSRRHHH